MLSPRAASRRMQMKLSSSVDTKGIKATVIVLSRIVTIYSSKQRQYPHVTPPSCKSVLQQTCHRAVPREPPLSARLLTYLPYFQCFITYLTSILTYYHCRCRCQLQTSPRRTSNDAGASLVGSKSTQRLLRQLSPRGSGIVFPTAPKANPPPLLSYLFRFFIYTTVLFFVFFFLTSFCFSKISQYVITIDLKTIIMMMIDLHHLCHVLVNFLNAFLYRKTIL